MNQNQYSIRNNQPQIVNNEQSTRNSQSEQTQSLVVRMKKKIYRNQFQLVNRDQLSIPKDQCEGIDL